MKVIQYIRGTRELTLTIEPGEGPKWCVDSLCAVHPDMRNHSGIINMMLGKGATYTASTKQKLNTKSSTEDELVANNDAMAQGIWTRHFLAAQGEYVPITMVYQENLGTILVAENRRQSSSMIT